MQHTIPEYLCWVRALVHLVWCPAPAAEQTQQVLSGLAASNALPVCCDLWLRDVSSENQCFCILYSLMNFYFMYVSDWFRFFLNHKKCLKPILTVEHSRNVFLYSVQSMKCFLLFALGVVPSNLYFVFFEFYTGRSKEQLYICSSFLFHYLFYRSMLWLSHSALSQPPEVLKYP